VAKKGRATGKSFSDPAEKNCWRKAKRRKEKGLVTMTCKKGKKRRGAAKKRETCPALVPGKTAQITPAKKKGEVTATREGKKGGGAAPRRRRR